MTRESSSFKFHTLLLNCCRRQLPLFTLSLVALLTALPVSTILRIQELLRYWNNSDPETRASTVRSIREMVVAQQFASLTLIALAVIAGISLFHYLHSRSQSDFFGALPVKRGQMFAIRAVIGVLAVVPAYLIGVALACGVCVSYGFSEALDSTMLLYSVLAHVAGFLLVYAVSILSAVVCGNTLVSLLLCGWLQFGLFAGIYAVRRLIEILYPAYIGGQPPWEQWLAPPVVMINLAGSAAEANAVSGCVLPALASLLAAAALFALGCALCRVRRSEFAGTSLAFPLAELPLKLYIVAVTGIACGLVFYTITEEWSTMFLGIAIGVVLTACLVEIVYDQDFHSLFHRWKSSLVFGAVLAAVLACMSMDITHWNSRLPDRADIVGANLTADSLSWNCSTEDENYSTVVGTVVTVFGVPVVREEETEKNEVLQPLSDEENLDIIYESATMGAAAMRGDRSKIMEQGENGVSGYQVTFHLKNGKTFRRQYYLPWETESMAVNGARVRFSAEYLDTRTTIAQAEKRKNQITFLTAVSYADADDADFGRQITNRNTIQSILETLKEESLSVTKEYAATHVPVAMLRVATQEFIDNNDVDGTVYNTREWRYYGNTAGLFDIPVYACETRTLAQLQLYAKGFAPAFSDGTVARVVQRTYNEGGTVEETVYSDPQEIAALCAELVPSFFDCVIDPVCALNYDEYVVTMEDGRSVTCTTWQAASEFAEAAA